MASRRAFIGAAGVIGGTTGDAVAALVFSGYWYPPPWLHWIGWTGFLLPGLLLSAVGLGFLVGRPRGWYDSADDCLDRPLVRVLSSVGWLVGYISGAAGLYVTIVMIVQLVVPPCLDPSCILFGGFGAFVILGYVALVGGPVAVLLLGISQVLREFMT